MTAPPDAESLRALIARTAALPVAEQLPPLCEAAAALTQTPLPARQRLAQLEDLRPALWQALEAYEQQELARALPFSAAEMERWHGYIEGWSVLLAAYLQALADTDQQAEDTAGLAPLLLQRVLRQAVQVAVACFRAYQPVEPGLWRLVHAHFQRAEREGVAKLAMADTTLVAANVAPIMADPILAADARGSVTDAWLHLLLLDFCDPYGFSPGQQALAQRWTGRLARLARLCPEPVSHGGAGFLVVRLESSEGLRLLPNTPDPAVPSAGQPRFVDLGAAHEQVRRLLARLRLGMPPAQLGLGEQCTRDEAEQVLERIQWRWRTSRRRAHPRRPMDEGVRIAPGLALVHRYLEQRAQGQALEGGEGLHEGRLVDQSPSGLGLTQPAGGARLRCGQLLVLARPRELLLGAVRWMSMDTQGGLRFGVRLLAGRARAAAVRTSATTPGHSEPALLLDAQPTLGLPATLIAAPGTFFPGRELQLIEPSPPGRVVVLERLMETGADFERISYQNAE